jgi:hypothetical protein
MRPLLSPGAPTRLGETPLVHPTAEVVASALGRFTEISERSVVLETVLGDYSYMMQDTQTWAAEIGKFVNIASYVRINAPQPPDLARDPPPLHLSRQRLFAGRRPRREHFRVAARERRPRGSRRLDRSWRNDHAGRSDRQRRGGRGRRGGHAPGRALHDRRRRSGGADQAAVRPKRGRMDALAWWDWDHDALRAALDDFRTLSAAAFLEKYEG